MNSVVLGYAEYYKHSNHFIVNHQAATHSSVIR